MTQLAALLVLAAFAVAEGRNQTAGATEDSYLTWPASRAEAIGRNAYKRGRAGGLFDGRVLKTERSYNYKLAATLFTPDVIHASARWHQLAGRLSDDATRILVEEAVRIDGVVVMVEIDPREGSGVIPNDWQAFLQRPGDSASAVSGTHTPALRSLKAFSGVLRRNYDYDRFWVVFPRPQADQILQDAKAVDLVVRIHDQEGKVSWPVQGQ